MTSDMTKQSSNWQDRVLDPQDQLWSSIDNLLVGLGPQERAQKLIDLVEQAKQPSPA